MKPGLTTGSGKLPDLAHRVLERAVAIDHGFDLDARALKQRCLNTLGDLLRILREELDLALGGLVGAEQTVLAPAAAVHGGVENVAQGQNGLAARGLDTAA